MIPTKEDWMSALIGRHGAKLQNAFSSATVAICGLGGLGSNIAVALARAGIGKLILIDFDRVDITNLHRQQYNADQIGILTAESQGEFHMRYRKLPHGNERISEIGLGLGNIHNSTDAQIEETFRYAIEHGVNLFDFCSGRIAVYEILGRVAKEAQARIHTQMHFGACYEKDTYGFSRDLELIKYSFEKVLRATDRSFTDFGYIHCIDEDEDFEDIMKNGLWDHVCTLKEQGVVHHIGFSSHTPAMAKRFLETGMIDLFMFSINPAYDYAYGSVNERLELYQMAQKMGVGITVMKPFAGGQLLDARRSPLNVPLNHYQYIQYALDRPAVISCLPGVTCVEEVKYSLGFFDAPDVQRDYSMLSQAAPSEAKGRCVYCNHCAPCPMGIDIGLLNKYYDLALVGDDMVASHYEKLSIQADVCAQCGHCEERCPFHVKQMDRMQKIHAYFSR